MLKTRFLGLAVIVLAIARGGLTVVEGEKTPALLSLANSSAVEYSQGTVAPRRSDCSSRLNASDSIDDDVDVGFAPTSPRPIATTSTPVGTSSSPTTAPVFVVTPATVFAITPAQTATASARVVPTPAPVVGITPTPVATLSTHVTATPVPAIDITPTSVTTTPARVTAAPATVVGITPTLVTTLSTRVMAAPTPVVSTSPVPTTAMTTPTTATPAPTTIAPTAMPTFTPFPALVATLPNWIGPQFGVPSDTACYRKTYRTKQCPPGYKFDKIATCWAECPVEYPVKCGMECIPQNKDCTLAVLSKVNAVATVALNAATSGVFGQLSKASKGVQTGVKCGQQLFSAVTKIVGYAKELEVSFPNTTKSQFQYLLSKSDFVVFDLPVAVTTCLGLPAPDNLSQAAEVVETIKKILDGITSKGEDVLDTNTFLKFAMDVGVGSTVSALKPNDISELKTLIDSGITCGTELKSIADRVVAAVKQIKNTAPSSPVDAIRLALTNSQLFLTDIPAVTASCVPKNADGGFATRDDIRKTFQIILDKIIDSSSNGNGKPLSATEYALKVTDFGLEAIAMFDPTGIASLAKEFIQPICGPTSFFGEVDDGNLAQALGLRTMGKAFAGSSGTWTKAGDGVLKIVFESSDNKDVSVNVFSGGDKIADVPVKKGTTVTWTKPLAELKDKTMYLDRWRPGLFGLPGTGGGSLLLWVPRTSQGGHLELRAKINVS